MSSFGDFDPMDDDLPSWWVLAVVGIALLMWAATVAAVCLALYFLLA